MSMKKKKNVDVNDDIYFFMLKNLEQARDKKLKAIEAFSKSKKRGFQNYFHTSKKLNFIEQQIEDSMNLRKNKMMIEFNNSECSSIKFIAVKSKNNIKCTTRFMSGKLLMFAKLSLKSFIYSLVELLSFPDGLVQEIYSKYLIERIFVYHVLTDTDSTSLQFIVVSSVRSTFTEEQVRNILFEIFPRMKSGKGSINPINSGNNLVFASLKIKKF